MHRRTVTALACLLVAGTAAVAAATPSAAAPASIVNSSLEQDANGDGVPDCFTEGGWGTSTATFARVPEGRNGGWAERLTISSYTDGDRKLVPTMSPECAPAVTPGQRYEASVWFRSDVWSVMVAYVQVPTGWQYWTQALSLPPSPTWTKATFALPPAPAGATALSFGQTILSVGSITTDDYAVTPLSTPPTTTTTTTTGPATTTTTSTTTAPPASTTTTTTTPAPEPCPAGYVGLGFDDGPDIYTGQLLDILEAKQAKATHFLIGNKITPELAPVVRRMASLGHPVGDHSWTHPYLTQMTDDEVRTELELTIDRLVQAGLPRPTMWRPPYEDVDARVRGIATSLGLSEVLWDLDTNDWQGITPEETARRIVEGARPGTIVLLHERIATTVAAMPATIDGLRARGFCLGVIRPSPTYNEQTRSYAEVGP